MIEFASASRHAIAISLSHGNTAAFLIKGMTVPSELAQSAGGLAFIFSRAMCVGLRHLALRLTIG
jgi:hypothetical protein